MAKTKKPTRKYDWALIRKDYVEGWQNGGGRHMPTLAELSKKYGPSPQRIRIVAARDKWTDARSLLTTKAQQIREKSAATELALYGVSVRRRILSVAERLIVQTARHFAQWEPSDAGPPPLADPLVLQRLSAALKTASEVAYASLGDTPGIEFEDLARDPRRRILIHMIPKPPPIVAADDAQADDTA